MLARSRAQSYVLFAFRMSQLRAWWLHARRLFYFHAISSSCKQQLSFNFTYKRVNNVSGPGVLNSYCQLAKRTERLMAIENVSSVYQPTHSTPYALNSLRIKANTPNSASTKQVGLSWLNLAVCLLSSDLIHITRIQCQNYLFVVACSRMQLSDVLPFTYFCVILHAARCTYHPR